MKILAFGASTSRRSINKQLADWASRQLDNATPTLIDLNDFEMPIFSIDRQLETGIPSPAQKFKNLVKSHDGILISFAEHNGGYSSAFKNIFDWVSRMEGSVWEGKPMFLMATSTGRRGGASVLEIVTKRFPYNGGEVVTTFSLPLFKENFSAEKGIINEELRASFYEHLAVFENRIKSGVEV